jgi:hypothetical protein
MLMGSLRMLLGDVRVLFSLPVVAFSMMLCCGAVRLGSVFVMFRSLIVFISSHCGSPCSASSRQTEELKNVPNVDLRFPTRQSMTPPNRDRADNRVFMFGKSEALCRPPLPVVFMHHYLRVGRVRTTTRDA